MRRFFSALLMAVAVGMGVCGSSAAFAADEYVYDPIHSSITFKARHLDVSWIHGRFNEASGKFSIDREDPTKSTFELSIVAASVDTNQKMRDEHLRQPDYFDVKQFPTIDFKSTSVKVVKGGYEVTGDFTMHGKTKSVTFVMTGGKEATFMGKKIVGFSIEFKVKRSDFGFDPKAIGPIGDEALIYIDCEGTRK